MASLSRGSSTSLSLIQQARTSDPAACVTLSQLYGPLVYRWSRQCGLQAHDSADVVQNVFLSVFRSLDRFSYDQPQASFRGWLWTITRNAVRESQRKRRELPIGAELDAPWSPAEDDSGSQLSNLSAAPELAQRALGMIRASLDGNTWEAFHRTVMLDESAAEVARDLGVAPKLVRQAKYRVLLRLRRMLADS